MKKLMKYETPELEITRFVVGDHIMDATTNHNGDIVTDPFMIESETEVETPPPLDIEF